MRPALYQPVDPEPSAARLSVSWERPVGAIPDETGFSLRPFLLDRTRLIIEGEADFVQRLHEALLPLLKEIEAEIGGPVMASRHSRP